MLRQLIWVIYAVILYISFFLLLVFLEEGRLRQDPDWPEKWPSVSLIIPAYNEEDTIGMTIESVDGIEYPEEKYDIIVVNDGSEDQTREIVEEYSEEHDITVINQENQGKGAALNTGLAEAEGDLVACVDADSRLDKHSVKNIVADMDDKKAGIASAMKVYQPGNLLQRLQWVEYMVGIFLRNVMGLIDSIHVTPGPLSIYRREILEDVGGFDEDSLVEDQEICFRFQEQHWEVGHSRKGEVHTVAPATLKELYNQRYRWYRGSLENILKYKHMMMNPEYGDFGIFAVPSKLAQGFLSIAGLSLLSYLLLKPLYSFVLDFLAVGLDAITLNLDEITVEGIFSGFYWSVISFDVVTWMLLGSLFFLSIFVSYLSAIHTEEKLFEHGYIPVIIYVFWYFLFIGLMWAKVTVDFLLRREGRW